MSKLVTISIAVHNQCLFTEKCLDSLLATVDPTQLQIIITDNASNDGTGKLLASYDRRYPGRFVVVRRQTNQGFIAPHNAALTLAQGIYFLILNNDIEFLRSDWLTKMVDQFKANSMLGICGSTGACQELDDTFHGKPGSDLEYVEASCLMIPVSLAKVIGLFDTSFRHGYCEDSDLSLRVRERGYQIKTLDLGIRHHRAVTSNLVAGSVDLWGYEEYNRAICKQRWASYLQRRTFEKRVVFERYGAVGDVILMTPLLRAYKQRYPYAHISVLTHFREVFYHNPNVSETKSRQDDLNFQPVDEFHCLQDAYEHRYPDTSIADSYFASVGLPVSDDPRLELFPDVDDAAIAAKLTDNTDHLAIIHPGRSTAWPGKFWSPVAWQRLVCILQQAGWKIALVGNEDPVVQCDYDLTRKTTVLQTAALCKRAKLFVGIDSAPLHIAQAMNTPGVGLFGCTDPRKILFCGGKHLGRIQPVYASSVACLGCRNLVTGSGPHKCFRSEVYCMNALTVEKVLEMIELVLKTSGLQWTPTSPYVLENGKTL